MGGSDAGMEWVVDAAGCPSELLCDADVLAQVCQRVVDELTLKVVGHPVWHQFPEPGGVTGIYLLSESHLTCHTFPETGLATFNLYCCRPRPAWPWRARLRELLGATRVKVRTIRRGQLHRATQGAPR